MTLYDDEMPAKVEAVQSAKGDQQGIDLPKINTKRVNETSCILQKTFWNENIV